MPRCSATAQVDDEGDTLPETVQGDTSHWFKPPIDIKTKVAFQYMGLILKQNFCSDVNGRFELVYPRVPFYPLFPTPIPDSRVPFCKEGTVFCKRFQEERMRAILKERIRCSLNTQDPIKYGYKADIGWIKCRQRTDISAHNPVHICALSGLCTYPRVVRPSSIPQQYFICPRSRLFSLSLVYPQNVQSLFLMN